ncbi:MAG: hypothetical protein P1V97_15630 [Planctomycetota bacterium]|nr:hypothetical protein [Planctomycetota bacterium]
MRRTCVLLLAFLSVMTGCTAEVVPAEKSISNFENIVVAIAPSRKAKSHADLTTTYSYVNVLASMSQYMQQTLCALRKSMVTELENKAAEEGLKIDPSTVKTEFQTAYPDTLEATKNIEISENATLDPALAAKISKTLKADALIVGRVFVYAQDWKEFARRTRAGLSIVTYSLRFGVAFEFCLFDLKTGKLVDYWSDRNPYIHKAKRRLPPDPRAIGATKDPSVDGRVIFMIEQTAKKVNRKYLPRVS